MASSGHILRENPVIGRLSKVNEYDSQSCCTYKGIAAKLMFFVLMVVVGIGICFLMKTTHGFGSEAVYEQVLYKDSEPVVIYSIESIAIAVAGIVSVVSSLVATFARPTVPVTGSLFCASIGFTLAWLAMTFTDQYMAPVLLALIVTLMIVFTMGFLYGMGIVTVTAKMKTFIMTSMLTVCLGSLLMFILSFIPFTSGFVASIMSNPVLSIGGSILMVIVGTLFLLVDFDRIKECVDNGLPKKYEWSAAYGLAFSVIWLYFKVLSLIMKIIGKSRN